MKNDPRSTSQQIAHQTVSGIGIIIFVIPFAIIVALAVFCMVGGKDTRTDDEIRRDHNKWQQQHNANANRP